MGRRGDHQDGARETETHLDDPRDQHRVHDREPGRALRERLESRLHHHAGGVPAILRRAAAATTLALLIGGWSASALGASLPPATAVSAGGTHTCALLSDGTVKCWGRNERGQLGDGTRTWRLTAVAVSGLTGATGVSAGGRLSCAALTDGTARCWGYNDHGQLGDGTTTSRSTPVAVRGLSGVVAVSAGTENACALLANHTVACWGDNSRGELGNGTRVDSSTPVVVPGLTDVTAVGADDLNACALHTNEAVSCWGWSGKLGPVEDAGDQLSPTLVPNLTDAVALGGAGPYGSCAVTTHNVAKCWDPGSAPMVVPGFDHVKAFSFSLDGQQTEHSCALIVGSAVTCQSDNPYMGQVGIGVTSTKRVVTVTGLHGVTAISANSFYTCALLSGGGVKCWGDNSDGQLGDGTTETRFRPVSVLGIDRPAPVQRIFMQTSGCAGPVGRAGMRPVWAQHPVRFSISCNGVIQVIGVRWRHWGSATARATATLVLETCTPNCATGPTHRYSATVVASDVKQCRARRVYGTVTAHWTAGGHRRTGDGPVQGCL
jgi:hypothetical protein